MAKMFETISPVKLYEYPTVSVYPSTTTTISPSTTTPKVFTYRRHIVSELIEEGYWVKMTGSRVTKDGWTEASDWDYVVFDPDQKLKSKYFDWTQGSEVDNGEFLSIKQGDINLILVDKEEIWKKYIIATNLIKALNSKTKEERIKVFDSVFGKDSNTKAVEF